MKIYINKNISKGISHLSLKQDIENGNIFDTTIIDVGKTLDSPETWEIECVCFNDHVDSYLYDVKEEYYNDINILKNLYGVKL